MSKGVKIFSWLIIILNIFILSFSFDFRSYFDCLQSLSKGFIIAIIFYSILSSLCGIIIGVGLLKLKNKMRQIGIGMSILDLFFGTALFLIAFNDLKQYSYKIASFEIARNLISIDSLAKVVFYLMAISTVAFFIMNLLFILFFTRPKIKEQFS